MTTMVYTQVEYTWDGVAEQYVVKAKQGYEYDGPIILMKKAFKGVLGTVLKVVATVAAAYFLGPLGVGLFNSTWAAGAAAGALVGGVTGGVKGALMGGVMGGVGGYLAGGDIGLGGSTPTEAFIDGGGIAAGYNPAGASAGLSAGTAVEAGSAITGGAAEAGMSAFPEAAGYGVNPWEAVPDVSSFTNAATASTGTTNWNQGPMPGGGNMSEYSFTSAPNQGPMPDGSNLQQGGGFFSNLDWKGAGLKLGAQALGSAIAPEGPDMGEYNNYLKSQTQANKDVTAYNINSMNKKAAVGDQLYGDANAMNPDTTAEQYRRNTQNQMESAWLDQEGRMAGLNPRAVESARRTAQLNSSLAQGSSYAQGQNAGLQQRLGTYGTAGSMYGQVQAPGDTLGASYLAANRQSRDTASNIGGAIEQAFQPVTSNTTTGTQKTRDQDVRHP